MKRAILVLLSLVLAGPAFADKRVDDALAKAQDSIRKGKPDEAVKNMTKTASQVKTAEAYLALARIQRQVGQRDEATASVRTAGEVATTPADKATALAAAADLALSEGSGKDALAQAQAAVAAQETSVSLSALARAQARAENVTAALATIDKAMKAGAPTAAVHEAHGEVLLAGGRAAEAAEAFRRATAADAGLASARAGLASALLAQGKTAEAVTEAKAAVAADANSVEAQYVLGTVLLAQDAKNWSDAISAAQQAVFMNPKNVQAQVAVARIFEAQGNYAQAANAYRAALAADPDYVPAMTGSIQMLARQGKYEEALAQARQLAAARPNSASANFLVGEMLARRGQWAEAAAALEKAVAAGLNTATAHAYLGTAYSSVRKPAEAMASYERAVALDPGNVGYRTTYGLLLGMNGQEAKGIAELQKVVANPAYKDADAWINLGWLYRSSDPINGPESVKAYQRALQIDPENTQALLGLAWAQYYSKSYPAAVESFTKVATTDETLAAGAYSGAGWSHLFNKDLAKAEEFAKKGEAAGRRDAKLFEQIAAVRAGREAQQRAIDRAQEEASRPVAVVASTAEDLAQQLLHGGSVSMRINAARGLPKFGAAGLDPLITSVVQESNQSVRIAAANAIGTYGPAGKKADVHLRQVLEGTKCGEVIPTPACLERETKMQPLQKAVVAAIRRINGM